MAEPLDIMQPSEAALQLQLRAAAMQQACVIAGGNLRIAQHRDTLRYATVRSGAYHPRLRRYTVGDYVYVRVGQPNSSLDMSHFDHILRVKEIKPSGNLVLQGRCGKTVTTNVTNVAPCHLPNIDTAPLEGLARPLASLACEVCGFTDQEEVMLLCDACETGWHIHCLTPALPAVPEGDEPWVCPKCTAKGVTPDQIKPPVEPVPAPRRNAVIPSAHARKSDKTAKALDGRRVRVGNRPGTVRFTSADNRPYYFDIEYDDNTRDVGKSTTFVRNRLLPPGTAAVVTPPAWDLTVPEGVEAALQQLMPGSWTKGHMSSLANQIARTYAEPQSAPITPTVPGEVHALLKLVDFTQIGAVLDPWAGNGMIKVELGKSGVPVVDNDINPTHTTDLHMDALQPAFYQHVATLCAIDAVVASPWFTVLDLALPLAIAAARTVACVHVPGHYITDAHPIRARYLAALMAADRLHVLWNLPKGPMGRRCGWLLVFATPALKSLIMRKGSMPSAPFSYAD
jgi:hypothetical protein